MSRSPRRMIANLLRSLINRSEDAPEDLRGPTEPSTAKADTHRNGWDAIATSLTFTRDWAGLDFWDELLAERELPTERPVRILEIGAFEGLTTCYLLHRLDESGRAADITTIDTWQGSREHQAGARHAVDFTDVERRFDENVRLVLQSLEREHRFTKLHTTSLTALARLVAAGSCFDLIFVDGSHEAHDVLADAILAIELTEVGGTLVFDDYNWLRVKDDPTLGAFYTAPRVAIDAALNINRHRLKVVGPKSLKRLTLERRSG